MHFSFSIFHLLGLTKSIPLPFSAANPTLSSVSRVKNIKIIIVGIPNVGKSTIINRLRAIGTSIGGKAVKTGAIPGITRSLSGLVHISSFKNYKLFLHDTPGILMPKIQNEEMSLKIALIGGMADSVINLYQLAEYLLTILNNSKSNSIGYMKKYKLDNPISHLPTLLERVAQIEGTMKGKIKNKRDLEEGNENTGESKIINLTNTIQVFLKAFRYGKLGRILIE